MDQPSLPPAEELQRLIGLPSHEQTVAHQQRITQLAFAGVDDSVLQAATMAIKQAFPPRIHNPLACIDPAKNITEAIYHGKYMVAYLLEQECRRRQSPQHPDHIT